MAKENNYNVLAKPTAKRGRNAFNLNNQHVYSMKAGLLNPVKAVHFMPGDYFKMKANDFTISFPMKSAPFLRARKEFSFYSVYYNAVWSLFNQYMAGRQDPKSSAFGTLPVLQEPRIKLMSLFAACLNQFGAYLFLEHMIPFKIRHDIPDLSEKDLQTLANNAKSQFFESEFLDPFDYGVAYQSESMSFTFTWDWHNIPMPSNIGIFSWDAFSVTPFDYFQTGEGSYHNGDMYQDIVGHYRWANWLRKLDMYGYGNLYPLFSQLERNISTIIADALVSTSSSAYQNALYSINAEIYALTAQIVTAFCTFDNTGTGEEIIIPAESDIKSYKMVNLYPLCAHNSIFYHFFRNSFYDDNYCSHDFSLDFVSAKTGGDGYNEVKMRDFSARFLDCEYHQWKKDMFTSVMPDEQFGAVSIVDLSTVTESDNNRWTRNDGSTPSLNPVYASPSLRENSSGYDIKHTHEVYNSFDVIALKRAEMLQEYRQTLMRAGNKTSDVFRALYGGSPSSEHLDDIIPRFLETFGEDIIVDPVISTANTEQGDNGKLGDISARAKSSGQSNEFKFDAGQNFGCIIALAYVVPTSMYNSYMLDKHLLELTPEQHFLPPFENCGLEDVLSDELNMMYPAIKIHSLGKQARYYHKKTDVDKVHGAFCAMPSWGIAERGDVPLIDSKLNDAVYYGEFNHWISSRLDMQQRNTTAVRDFYINPSVLDNVFVRAAGSDQADDQFICTTLFEIDATKQISKVGIVNFV